MPVGKRFETFKADSTCGGIHGPADNFSKKKKRGLRMCMHVPAS